MRMQNYTLGGGVGGRVGERGGGGVGEGGEGKET